MSASKRPSTSSLRRFITSRPYVPVAELRRRFGLDEPDAMAFLHRNGTNAWIGLPDREAAKIQDLWDRDELGVELSVEVHAPVIVGVYPMRMARYVMENGNGANGANGHPAADGGNGHGSGTEHGDRPNGNGGERRRRRPWLRRPEPERSADPHAPRPMNGAPSYGAPSYGAPASAPELPPD